MCILAACLTAIYSHRLLTAVFLGNITEIKPFAYSYKFTFSIWDHEDEKNYKLDEGLKLPMLITLMFLLFCSILIGYFLSDLFLGFGTNTWILTFTVLPLNYSLINIEFVSPFIKNLPILCSLFFMFLTCIRWHILDMAINTGYIYSKNFLRTKNFYYIYLSSFSYYAGFFNLFYNNIFINFTNKVYLTYVKTLDRGFFELIGPFGIYLFFRNIHYYYKNTWYVILSFTLFIFISFISLFIIILLFFYLSNIIFLSPNLIIDYAFFILLIILCSIINNIKKSYI